MDKIGRDTGPGKVKEIIVGKNPSLIWDAVLYNYNIDGNIPKDRHKDYMKRKLLPLLKNGPYHVKIFGRASKLGAADYNQTLSVERALRVKKYLISLGLPESKVPGQEMRAHGEVLATGDAAFDRSVIVRVAHGAKTKPIPIPIPNQTVPPTVIVIPGKPKPPGTTPPKTGGTQFKIKHLGSSELAFGAGHLFWIVDKTTNEETTILLTGGSVGAGIAPVTGKGEWVDFSTKKPTTLYDFVGTARFTEAPSVLWWSDKDGFLTFDKVETHGAIRIKSGVTIGLSGGAVTTGPTTMLEAPNPYKPRYTYDPITGKWELD